MKKDEKHDNVINFDANRRRQKKVREKSKNTFSSNSSKKLDWRLYIQFVAFIAVFAFLLQQCGM